MSRKNSLLGWTLLGLYLLVMLHNVIPHIHLDDHANQAHPGEHVHHEEHGRHHHAEHIHPHHHSQHEGHDHLHHIHGSEASNHFLHLLSHLFGDLHHFSAGENHLAHVAPHGLQSLSPVFSVSPSLPNLPPDLSIANNSAFSQRPPTYLSPPAQAYFISSRALRGPPLCS